MNELYHHGILGQKWGVRRYQNKDGSLTSVGKKRKENSNDIDSQKSKLTDKQKTYIKIGAAAVGTALATYGSYSVYKYFNNEYTKRLLAKGAYIANDHTGGSSAVFASGNATNYVSRKGISDNLINKIDLMKEYKKSEDNSAWKKYRKKGTYTGNYKNMTLTTPWGSKMSFDKKKGSAKWNT